MDNKTPFSEWYSRKKAVDLLTEEGVPEYKIWHDTALADFARQVVKKVEEIEGIQVDGTVVDAGCMMHDLGIGRTKDDLSPIHITIGGRILREKGWPELVARCVECHEFAGIDDAVEAADMGIDEMGRSSYRIETWEEKIVAWADHFIGTAYECMGDPWADPYAVVKTNYPYLRTVVMRWSGKVVDVNHPGLKRVYKLQNEMMRYTDKSFVQERALIAVIKAMQEAIQDYGLKLPYPYAADLDVDF
jgi:HD superfamily phosphodiesterase